MNGLEAAVADVKAYLGPNHSFTDDEILTAVETEVLAQAKVCTTEQYVMYTDLPQDLQTALVRRSVRALQMKAKPLGYEVTMEGNLSYISANDSEIRRLEAAHRKMVVR